MSSFALIPCLAFGAHSAGLVPTASSFAHDTRTQSRLFHHLHSRFTPTPGHSTHLEGPALPPQTPPISQDPRPQEHMLL